MSLLKKFILIILPLLFVGLAGFFVFRFLLASERVVIELDQGRYKIGEEMKVSIKNNLWNKEVCLSSCYPYFLQKKDGNWQEYSYENCRFEDKIIKCLNPREKKVFETSVPHVLRGLYRISVPVCKNCNLGTVFHEEERFHSNLFEIK